MMLSYRTGMWVALVAILIQTGFYNLYTIPRYNELIDTYYEYVQYLEWINDGCYEIKVQLLNELDGLSPHLESPKYMMRLRVK